MARRQQRRPVARKGVPKALREDTGALDPSARRVLAAHGGDPALESLVRDLQQLREEGDRVAFDEPSPDAWREYRRISRQLIEAQRVFVMATAG